MSGVKERLVITNPRSNVQTTSKATVVAKGGRCPLFAFLTKGSPSSAPRREDRLRKITREMIIEAISTPTDAERLCVSDATMAWA